MSFYQFLSVKPDTDRLPLDFPEYEIQAKRNDETGWSKVFEALRRLSEDKSSEGGVYKPFAERLKWLNCGKVYVDEAM